APVPCRSARRSPAVPRADGRRLGKWPKFHDVRLFLHQDSCFIMKYMLRRGGRQMEKQPFTDEYLAKKLAEAKTHFARTVDCKHTEFDDLYPYMVEHPQFFWYKRYVAWSQLLTIVDICRDCEFDWSAQ